MLSAFIPSILSYTAVPLVWQLLHHRYVHPGPLVLRTAPFKYNGRTAQPLERTSAPGCDEPTSRCQTSPSMWTLGRDKPVIPRVTFVRWATAFPFTTAGSLSPTFVSARHVCLSVKLPSAFTLFRAISVRAEETFGRLRYSLGGDRPSQTARLTLSPNQLMIHG